jgi:hypothetical protein
MADAGLVAGFETGDEAAEEAAEAASTLWLCCGARTEDITLLKKIEKI